MYSFAIADAGSSDEMWAWFQAGQSLAAAIDAFEAAGAALVSLTADTEWASDGVRALHQKLVDAQASGEVEIGRLHTRSSELDSAGAA
jgi:hypothetical protein